MRLMRRRGCLRLGSFPRNGASFNYRILIFGLKSVAAKAATAATVPTPLSKFAWTTHLAKIEATLTELLHGLHM